MTALRSLLPGISLSFIVALAAMFVSVQYGAPTMLMALLFGIALSFLRDDARCAPGIKFSSRTILRIGVAFLGARLTLWDISGLGIWTPVLVIFALVSTILLGAFLAPLLGRSRWFGVLTGGSVGICGASAALALSSVIPQGKDGIAERDVAFTVVGVTTLSTVAMVLYPLLTSVAGFDDQLAGIFIGATIHDVAQVVGAGYSVSDYTGETATVIKLLRVAVLIPVIFTIFAIAQRTAKTSGKTKTELPWFLLGFVALMLANTFGILPDELRELLKDVSKWGLVIAVSALGVKTQLGEFAQVGPRALVIIVAETLWIAAIVFVAVQWIPLG